jgi:drug/metabolite transporter (DMT)-like permease
VTNYLSPLFVALASPLLREPLGRRTPLAALVAFVATGALVGIGQTGPGTRLAALEGGTSAIFFASGMLVARRLTPFLGPWALVGFHDLLAAPVVWLGARTPVTSASRDELLRLAFGAVLSGTFAAGLYFYGLARIPAARTAVIAYVEPVSASLIGVFVLHQEMTVVKVVAIAVILGAGLAVATEKMPREPRSVSEPEGHAAV